MTTSTVLTEQLAERDVLLVDGATGTQLTAAGLEPGDARPQRLIHRLGGGLGALAQELRRVAVERLRDVGREEALERCQDVDRASSGHV